MKYVNPNHPAGDLYPQEAGFLKGRINAQKQAASGSVRSQHGTLAARSYQTWVADQANKAERAEEPVTRRSSPHLMRALA